MMENDYNNNSENIDNDIENKQEKTDNEAPVNTSERDKSFESSSTYAYTNKSNPDINKDEPHGGIHTTYIPHCTTTTQDTSYIPKDSQKKSKTKSEKTSFSKSTIAWMLVACFVFSSVFGIGGMFVGYKIFSNGRYTSSGNNELTTTLGGSVVDQGDTSVASAVEKAANAVVEIRTEVVTTSPFYGQYVQSGAGSGVIIDAANGYIVTCAHVVDGSSGIKVTLKDGTSYNATTIGSDSRTDIAVIQIEPTSELTAAALGDSDKLTVGQTAIAIGNPLGTLGGTVSSGIISALNREITIDSQNYTLLQIDTSINPGNSGGGLFDIAGNLIGVVNAKSSGSSTSQTSIEGLGFAIPINQAIEVANQLVKNGYVGGRVNLGIYVYEVNSSTNSASLYQSEYSDLLDYITDYGVYFLKYQSGQNGDFKFGDRIIAIDGVSVSTRSDITSVLEDYSIGDTVKITVSRLNSDRKRSQMVEFELSLAEYVPQTEENQ